MSKVLWGISFAAGLVVFFVGAQGAWDQHRKITTSRPVEVTVLSVGVRKHVSHGKSGTSTSYEPVVEYRYEVEGRARTGRSVFPRVQRGKSRWANEIVDRFPPGSVQQGFYVPGAVHEAFLIPRYSFEPYALMIVPVGALALAVFLAYLIVKPPPEPPLPRSDGWHAVAPSKTIGRKLAASLAMAAVSHGAALFILGHFFVVAGPTCEIGPIVFTAIYEGAGMIPVALALYFYLLGRSVANAEVSMNTEKPQLGGEVAIRAEQEARRELEVNEVRVGLVCHESKKVRRGSKTTVSTTVRWQQWETALRDRSVYQGDTLKAEVRLPVPAAGEPSTPPGQKGYPRYRWSIALRTKITGGPDYQAEFPITVGGLSNASRATP
jgi:hypothetical protein